MWLPNSDYLLDDRPHFELLGDKYKNNDPNSIDFSANLERLKVMILWSSSITIHSPPETIFDFLVNIQNVQQAKGSPVLALDLITADPPRLGSRYREIVKMTPFIKGEFLSEITIFKPSRMLEMTWQGPGMAGFDRYELETIQDGITLHHKKCTSCTGLLRIVEPLMRRPLIARLEQRLVDIKRLLEESEKP